MARVTKWDDFVRRVRRHRPSDLLTAIAAANITIAPEGWFQPGPRVPALFPWGLAAAARESIRAGNEHRTPGVTGRDLAQICGIYGGLYDPVLDDRDALACVVRIAYEQFPYQEALFFGLTRSRLLFGDPSASALAKLRIVDETFWEQTIGLPLELLFAAGMLFGVGANVNEGRFDLSWYEQPNFVQVRDIVPLEHAQAAMNTIFGASIDELRGMFRPPGARGFERLAFNPLHARPFVRFSETTFLAPVPTFVFWRASAPSLYMALERLDRDVDKRRFTDDVGTLFEDYVARQGEQLRDVRPIAPDVYREIEYRRGAFTTDLILVWPDFVLLVEAKASRLTEESRMGGPSLVAEIDRTIGKAVEQIETTAELIAARAPALAHIPADRPIYGLVVTLEPYHFVGVDEISRDKQAVPISIGSISDFERFIADSLARPRTEPQLAAQTNPSRTGWTMAQLVELSGEERFANPMLDTEHDELMRAVFGSTDEAA